MKIAREVSRRESDAVIAHINSNPVQNSNSIDQLEFNWFSNIFSQKMTSIEFIQKKIILKQISNDDYELIQTNLAVLIQFIIRTSMNIEQSKQIRISTYVDWLLLNWIE